MNIHYNRERENVLIEREEHKEVPIMPLIQDAKPWLVKYPKEVPPTIEYGNKTIHGMLQDSATKYPRKDAIYFFGKTMTYKELYEATCQFAHALLEEGLQKGDRVAIMLPNCPQAVIAYYGTLMAGGIVVQTNPLYVERELLHQLYDSEAKMIICLDLLYPRVMKVKKQTSLQKVIVTAIKDYLPFPKNLIYPYIQKRDTGMEVSIQSNQHTLDFKRLLKVAKKDELHLQIDAEEVALFQYTGGTTGLAKGVMLTHRNLVANTLQCLHWMYELRGKDERTLAALPFFHVYGMTVSMNLSILNSGKMYIVPKFDPAEILKMIEKHKISIFPGAPTMYIALINHPEIKRYDLSSIKACISGSASLPYDVQTKFEEITGGKLVEGYGLTEASPVTHCNPIWGERREGSIGLPWPDTDAVIFCEGGTEEANVNEIGELAVRGPQVMKGYWNRQEETEATIRDGWLLTGDMGYRDEDGYFYIVDRKKDMIIAGGFNIYPREIEEVLFEHPSIQEVAVVGVPDPYRGETVKAFVVLKEGHSVSEKELDDYCRQNLASYKVPRLYEFRDELPKTMVGKVLRRVLIEEARASEVNKDEALRN